MWDVSDSLHLIVIYANHEVVNIALLPRYGLSIYTYIHIYNVMPPRESRSSPRRTPLDIGLHGRLLHQKPLQIRIKQWKNPPEKHKPEIPKRQIQSLPQRHFIVFFFMSFGVCVVPEVADLFVYCRIIGQDDIEILSNCPADVAGFVYRPAEYKFSVAGFLFDVLVAMHGVNEAVSQRTLDGCEVRVE